MLVYGMQDKPYTRRNGSLPTTPGRARGCWRASRGRTLAGQRVCRACGAVPVTSAVSQTPGRTPRPRRLPAQPWCQRYGRQRAGEEHDARSGGHQPPPCTRPPEHPRAHALAQTSHLPSLTSAGGDGASIPGLKRSARWRTLCQVRRGMLPAAPRARSDGDRGSPGRSIKAEVACRSSGAVAPR